MITILASLIGFLSSMIPLLLKIWQDKLDKKHELSILDMQLKSAAGKSRAKLDAILANVDLDTTRVLYKTYNSGIRWIDGLNGLVRPLLTFGLFGAYIAEKIFTECGWVEEDQALLASISSFYFGTRYNYRVSNGYINGSNGNGANGRH